MRLLREELPERPIPGVRCGVVLREQRFGHGWGLPGGFSLTAANAFSPREVALNWSILTAFLGVPPESIRALRQVHGTRVVRRFREEEDAIDPCTGLPADAQWTTARGLVLVVFVADCCPVVLADPERGIVAIAHAGWRGALHGVVSALLEELQNGGARRDCLRAWIGPCADGESYEIGPEVAEQFHAFPEAIRPSPLTPHRSLLDVRSVIETQLDRGGVAPERVSISRIGTIGSTRYHSHRRDSYSAGRMVTYAMLSVKD
jgi:polyphenol oxidase